MSFLLKFTTPDFPQAITQVYIRRPKQPSPTASTPDTPTMPVPEDNNTTTEGNVSAPILQRSSRI